MAVAQENLEHLSLKLSEVLSDIGINVNMVIKRRNVALFTESVSAISRVINAEGVEVVYNFGSKSEGSTTLGINSDTDLLACLDTQHVIHDWVNWKHGVRNLLMVQDQSTAPGYCLLQRLRDDEPLALNDVPGAEHFKDAKGRVLLKNSMFDDAFRDLGFERHGPAGNRPAGQIVGEQDYVPAFHCSQWPVEGRPWFHRRSRSGWPSDQIKSECEMTGCFLVPVGSKIKGLDKLEWRISTGTAERYLMFSLNIPQLSCYVLMKMYLKTYPVFHNVISSYMCKTALFHCIENSDLVIWQERNLVHCLNQVLHVLYNFIHRVDCPHFIIPGNNLMAGRISAEQRHNLLTTIEQIIHSNGRALFDVHIDNLSERLHVKLNIIPHYPRHIRSAVEIQRFISAELCSDTASSITHSITRYNIENNSNTILDTVDNYICSYVRCKQLHANCTQLEKKACNHLIPLLCSTIGSLLASYCISINRPLSNIVMSWLKRGGKSDVSSGLLKMATVCYSMGLLHITEAVLCRVDQQYDRNVVLPVCRCHHDVPSVVKQGFMNEASHIPITDTQCIVSYCVSFMRGEVNIVPDELRPEYNRSSPEELQQRRDIDDDDDWMDLAVIDSLPYLHFLQYKTYGRLETRREQQRALHELQHAIRTEPTLHHKETALNVLGQCFQQENLPNEAYHCYERSLQVRERNNAARFHMQRLFER